MQFIIIDWDLGEVFTTDTITNQIASAMEKTDLQVINITDPVNPFTLTDSDGTGEPLLEWEDE